MIGLLSFLLLIFVTTEIITSLPPSYASTTTIATADTNSNDNDDIICSTAREGQQECTTKNDVHDDALKKGDDCFYAWSTNPPPDVEEDSLMYALFPNLTKLQLAWEVHPLLSRVSFTPQLRQQHHQHQRQPLNKKMQIPTILHNRSIISKLNHKSSSTTTTSSTNDNHDPILSLFSINDTPTILTQQPSNNNNNAQQPLHHGTDYKLLKKITLPPNHPTEPGEEYNGMIPKSSLTIEEIHHAFYYGGFSLVINKMQKRWRGIAEMGWRMEEEFEVGDVGVNLYLTPEVLLEDDDGSGGRSGGGGGEKHGDVRQGFEAHWDWMDVIVIQLSGRKRWSIAREPAVYLSNKDQKRKPTKRDVESIRHFEEFTLCPGDVLYIPRGHVHNASTVVFDDNFEDEDGEEGGRIRSDDDGMIDLDGCPTHSNEELSKMARQLGPSLHVTFGLLQSPEGTIESLLHHALDAFFASSSKGSNTYERVAIPANTPCSSPGRTSMRYDLEWKSVFHHLLAEVARREHRCDTLSHRNSGSNSADGGGGGTGEYERCNGTAILRRSVPLMLLTKKNKMKNNITTTDDDDHDDDDDNTSQQQQQQRTRYSNLNHTYLLALNTFVSLASIPKTNEFIASHLLQLPSDDELIFHYPGYNEKDVIHCPTLLKSLTNDDDETFIHLLMSSFHQFAKDNFHGAYKSMNLMAKEEREKRKRQQRLDLETVGQ